MKGMNWDNKGSAPEQSLKPGECGLSPPEANAGVVATASALAGF